jgi:hypothetical protein
MTPSIESQLFNYGKERLLYEKYDDLLTMSNKCKKTCIDDGKNFCPNASWTNGYCCGLDENCPRSDFCSNDNPNAPNLFKYLACPNEPACESKNIYPKYTGEKLTR